MKRKDNHCQVDSVPFYPNVNSPSGLLKYGLSRSCDQVNRPVRPDHLKGVGRAGTGVYSTPEPGGGW